VGMIRTLVGPAVPSPLGQGGAIHRSRAVGSVGFLTLGFLVSATAVFGAVYVSGAAFGVGRLPVAARMWLAVALCAAMWVVDAVSLRKGDFCRLSPRRQTPKNLFYERGERAGPLLWGLDTGLAVTTFRVSAATWASLGLVLLNLGPWWIGTAYAAGFCVPLAFSILAPRWRGDAVEPQWISRWLMLHRRWAQILCLFVLAAVAVVLGDAVLRS
jgi:hypothetical protein